MGPLSGIKVIELQGIGPGPFCGMMLADLGADVIRVDRAASVRGGDPARPPADVLARGRRSIGVDLKNPEGVETVGVVDHAALFPRVAAVVHHGGAGTTTTAARAGVPQVVVPHVLDQFYWAERVRRLGLGPPPLARRQLRSARLRETLAVVLGNEALAERARELGAALRADLDPDAALPRILAEA